MPRLPLCTHRSTLRLVRASANNGDVSPGDVDSILQKYSSGVPAASASQKLQQAPAPTPGPRAPAAAPAAPAGGAALGLAASTGVAALVLLNCGVFLAATLAATLGKSPLAASMAINPSAVKWWSFITSAFVHHNLEQLGRNMFVVYFFSQMVYKDLGSIGVWFTYLLCALGANLASWWWLPGAAKAKATTMLGLASTGGALGIFMAALVLSFRLSLGWLVGAAVCCSFVLLNLLYNPHMLANGASTLATSTAGSSGSVAGWLGGFKSGMLAPGMAWTWGALAGAAVVVLLARLPDPEAAK
eukprot:CAMPEP_0202891216 /NCGR_PEP_ID=MMETSP1392-20130828/1331_1 /ASSEMBLY_ACC=CAM_ASM_000868 /TAXON_ID=225041 /ORGANISM="Chlamydomonas chlamydogama, Strain SAG 11-48b" /LENGTH=300 /DNA_ID=CAMNT_0049574901 /DNA_START=30 /DNA_END=932 /DNA_ORIENTATION=-